MKTTIACVVCAGFAFLFMQFHLQGRLGVTSSVGGEVQARPADTPEAKFPDELSPVVRGQAAPKARAWARNPDRAPNLVLLRREGDLHPWHKELIADQRSDAVEDTDLVLVLSKQYRTVLEVVDYPHLKGTPPIKRYRHEMDAWLVEPRTGTTLTSKRFAQDARPVRQVETWDTTELGETVSFRSVLAWYQGEVDRLLKAGNPQVTQTVFTRPR